MQERHQYVKTNGQQTNVSGSRAGFLEAFQKLWQERNVDVAVLGCTRTSLCDFKNLGNLTRPHLSP